MSHEWMRPKGIPCHQDNEKPMCRTSMLGEYLEMALEYQVLALHLLLILASCWDFFDTSKRQWCVIIEQMDV
ncbi:hypothetical protein GOBAR_AA18965 [Gossypium barbadense]|uniref:Uncharacterized protein n=1 Tax=Gossypium barbadense TaxID=3634 RepID=A0A2P5XEC3_GOSBA|nr:hypothetical protein GOBAR_AA18965 [Gossypium barbadense]